jgi:hypothetical protein
VCLARDLRRDELIALKTMVADAEDAHASTGHEHVKGEVEIHTKRARSLPVDASSVDASGTELILPRLEHFRVASPSVIHRCLVNEPCGLYIASIRYTRILSPLHLCPGRPTRTGCLAPPCPGHHPDGTSLPGRSLVHPLTRSTDLHT